MGIWGLNNRILYRHVKILLSGVLILLFNNCGQGFRALTVDSANLGSEGCRNNGNGTCNSPTPTATPSATSTPRPSPTATPTPTPRPSATPTPQPSATVAPTPTPTPTPRPSPTPTATPRPSPTPTATPVPTPTPTATAVPPGLGWVRMANTKITSQCPPGFSCGQVVRAWNSAALDTLRNRLILFGGGHSNYGGNELYAMNLGTQKMTRLNDPGEPIVSCREDINTSSGIQPASRHTYDGVAYAAHADSFVIFGGAIYGKGGADCPLRSRAIWTYSFQTNKWTKKFHDAGFESTEVITAYDPQSELIYLHDGKNLFSYDIDSNQFIKLTNRTGGFFNATYSVSTIVDDPQRNRRWFVILAETSSGEKIFYYDLKSGVYEHKQLVTNGKTAIEHCYYPGFTYYPKDGSIVSWYGNAQNHACTGVNANSIYKLNLDTGAWTEQTFPNGPTASFIANGVFERFSYSAASDLFILVFDETQDAYTLRLED